MVLGIFQQTVLAVVGHLDVASLEGEDIGDRGNDEGDGEDGVREPHSLSCCESEWDEACEMSRMYLERRIGMDLRLKIHELHGPLLYEGLERRFIARRKETAGVGRALDSDGPQGNYESVDASALSAAADDSSTSRVSHYDLFGLYLVHETTAPGMSVVHRDSKGACSRS